MFTRFLSVVLLSVPSFGFAQSNDLLSDMPANGKVGDVQTVAVAPNPILQILMWVLIGIVFYLLLIRPQQKRLKNHQSMISNLRRGDRIVTSGGIVGTVQRVLENDEISLKISDDVTVTVLKQYVSNVLNKPEPVDDKSKKTTSGKAVK